MTTTSAHPLYYLIWCLAPGKGQRWKKAGRAATHAEAVAMIGGKGSWHIAPVHDPALAGTGGNGVAHPTTTREGPSVAVTTGPERVTNEAGTQSRPAGQRTRPA